MKKCACIFWIRRWTMCRKLLRCNLYFEVQFTFSLNVFSLNIYISWPFKYFMGDFNAKTWSICEFSVEFFANYLKNTSAGFETKIFVSLIFREGLRNEDWVGLELWLRDGAPRERTKIVNKRQFQRILFWQMQMFYTQFLSVIDAHRGNCYIYSNYIWKSIHNWTFP